MTMTIQQATTLASVFYTNPVLIEGMKFKKAHLEQLCQADRKVCFKALKMLSSAKLPDWKKKEPAKKLDDQRVADITAHVTNKPEASNEKKTVWYKAPFVAVAKLVNAVVLYIKNTFFGRISTNKLYNKVEVFRKEHDDAVVRVNKLESELIGDKKIAIDKKAAKQLDKQRNVFGGKYMKMRGILVEIWCEEEQNNIIRRDLGKRIHVEGHDNFIKEVPTFTQTVVKILTARENDIEPDYFKELKEKAAALEVNEVDVKKEFNLAFKKVEWDIQRIADELEEGKKKLENLDKEFKTLVEEKDLILTKFVNAGPAEIAESSDEEVGTEPAVSLDTSEPVAQGEEISQADQSKADASSEVLAPQADEPKDS